MPGNGQATLFAPASGRDALSTLDQLFQETRAYRTSREYLNLLRFIKRFPDYAPYNCFLLHTQNPGVCYVANAYQWRKRFNRRVKDGARPLVILVPFGPCDFVYDVADTEGDALPEAIIDPFRVTGTVPLSLWNQTLANCARDLIGTVEVKMHAGSAGWIKLAEPGDTVVVEVGRTMDGSPIKERRSAQYRLGFNSTYELSTVYATLAHELAHLYCGHLGTPSDQWWPDRRGLSHDQREFEAESVAYMVCARVGIENLSARYLSSYLRNQSEVPDISVEAVLKSLALIERMGQKPLPPRKYDPKGGTR